MKRQTILDTNVPTVHQQWLEYLERSNLDPATMNPIQHDEMKKAFYGGSGSQLVYQKNEVALIEDELKAVDVLQFMLDEVETFYHQESDKYTKQKQAHADYEAKEQAAVKEQIRRSTNRIGDLGTLAKKVRKMIRQVYGQEGSAFVLVFTHPEYDTMTHYVSNSNSRANSAKLMLELAENIINDLPE